MTPVGAWSGRAVTLDRAGLHGSLSDPVLDTMTFLNEVTGRHPGAVSFAPGRPYEGLFDVADIPRYLERYVDHLAEQGRSPEQVRTEIYQYGPAAGRIGTLVAESLRVEEGIDVPAAAVVVTVGAQEGMLLVLRALAAGPEDSLLVSSPCYVGITGAAAVLDVPVVPVPEGPDGLRPAALAAAVEAELARGRRPRACYVMPDHANPSGVTIPLAARRELLAVAARRGVLLIEDSPYRLVSAGPRIPTLKALDETGSVIHLVSYAKSAFPGARLGAVIADQEVLDPDGGHVLLATELARIKSMVTVNTPTLGQAVVAGMLLASGGRLSELTAAAAEHYALAMRTVLSELGRHFPPDQRQRYHLRWNRPAGGFFITLDVGFDADEDALRRSAEDCGVLWTPMRYFYPGGGGHRSIRLSVSSVPPDLLASGVDRLARFIAAETSRPGDRATHTNHV